MCIEPICLNSRNLLIKKILVYTHYDLNIVEGYIEESKIFQKDIFIIVII